MHGQPQMVGRYQIRQRLGAGGFATVYRAYDSSLDREVALKVLHPHLASDAGIRERFVREGRALARVKHPNVVGVYDTGEVDGAVYLATELIEGRSLSEIAEQMGPLPLPDVLSITEQMAGALAAVHARNLVHRDVKPANILIEDETRRAVLLDLGVARDLTNVSLTGSLLMGTPGFMAPEQVAAGGQVSPQTDVYQLAATVYSLLSGRAPFEGDTVPVLDAIMRAAPPYLGDLRPDLPPAVAATVTEAMAKNPERRPDGVRSFADQFRAAAQGAASLQSGPTIVAPVRPSVASDSGTVEWSPAPPAPSWNPPPPPPQQPLGPPSGGWQQPPPWQPAAAPASQRKIWPFVAAGGAAAAIVAGGVAFALRQDGDPKPPPTQVVISVTPTATATSTTTATATRTATATATRTVTATATRTVTATATRTVSPTPAGPPRPGDVILRDNFDDPTKATLLTQSATPESYLLGYDRGEYFIRKVDPNFNRVANVFLPGSYDDVSISVDARLVGESGNRAIYVVCRSSTDGQYRLVLDMGVGAFLLSRWDGDTEVQLGNKWVTRTDVLRTGTQMNKIELRCEKDTISAVINGQTVGSVKDGTYKAGRSWIGTGVFTGATGTVEVRFDNLVVTQR
ncbi:MAG: serine/threonine protein kinase [Chloroflexi bacterium]|nr:serine/threonine protein kinase [Chloroflexota bacterium]